MLPGVAKINLENVKKGIKAFKGSGDGLNKIIDAFMKFKLDKEQKGIDIDGKIRNLTF